MYPVMHLVAKVLCYHFGKSNEKISFPIYKTQHFVKGSSSDDVMMQLQLDTMLKVRASSLLDLWAALFNT